MLTKEFCPRSQDNVPVHNAYVAQIKAPSCGYKIHPYSPNLAPSNFHLSPNMKSILKGTHFLNEDKLISDVKIGFRQNLLTSTDEVFTARQSYGENVSSLVIIM